MRCSRFLSFSKSRAAACSSLLSDLPSASCFGFKWSLICSSCKPSSLSKTLPRSFLITSSLTASSTQAWLINTWRCLAWYKSKVSVWKPSSLQAIRLIFNTSWTVFFFKPRTRYTRPPMSNNTSWSFTVQRTLSSAGKGNGLDGSGLSTATKEGAGSGSLLGLASVSASGANSFFSFTLSGTRAAVNGALSLASVLISGALPLPNHSAFLITTSSALRAGDIFRA